MTRRLAVLTLAVTGIGMTQPIVVRQKEGVVRGFLALRSLNGSLVADGDSVQTTRGNTVTNRMTYRFKDGSVQEETVVFTQNGQFRVVSDHLVQKGPTFKRQLDLMINNSTGDVTVRYSDDKGKEKVEHERMKLPPDLANGIVPVVLKNLPAGSQGTTQSMVVAAPKPMIVKLQIHPEGEDSFTTGGATHKATRYNVHVDIGGIKGVLAPIVGKQPPDTRVWISQGDCPSFVRSEGAAFEGGDLWLTELISPAWPSAVTRSEERKQ